MSSSFRKRTLVTVALLTAAILSNAPAAEADSVNTTSRTVTEVASGIHVIRHPDAPDGFPQGNTTVIIGDRDVMVVDSCYLPSSAREDIAEIRKWTSKPVRFLVNTHWHYDHVMGNHDYAAAFPGIAIVSHHETKKQFAGYTAGFLGRYTENTKKQQAQVDTGLDAAGAKLSDHDREELRKLVAGRKPVWDEFSRFTLTVPDLTFDRELDVDLGNRQVLLRFLGRGNTAGDVVVFLPKEKIVVAGDLVDSPVPYLGGGYPVDEVKTLEAMAALDFETLVPGHGDVLQGKDYLRKVTALIAEVVAAVDAEIYRLGNGSRNSDAVREGVMKKLDVAKLRKDFAGDDKDNAEFFDGFSLQGVITAAFAQRWGK